jgi:hypothetical protein
MQRTDMLRQPRSSLCLGWWRSAAVGRHQASADAAGAADLAQTGVAAAWQAAGCREWHMQLTRLQVTKAATALP